MVWAGLFKDQLIGPYFFTRGTVTGEKYLYMLKEVVWLIFEVLFLHNPTHPDIRIESHRAILKPSEQNDKGFVLTPSKIGLLFVTEC